MIREGRSCDAILARTEKVTRKFMEACKKLKVIGRHGVGVNNLDLAAAKERNIVVTVTPHANTNAVAEHAMMLVCAPRCSCAQPPGCGPGKYDCGQFQRSKSPTAPTFRSE